MSALRRGQRFDMNGLRWRVDYVNASRAHCVSRVLSPITVTNKLTGERHTFRATRLLTVDLSPNSGIDVLAELESAR